MNEESLKHEEASEIEYLKFRRKNYLTGIEIVQGWVNDIDQRIKALEAENDNQEACKDTK